MKKYLYEGKNYEDALSHALEDQNTQEENLIITIKEEKNTLLKKQTIMPRRVFCFSKTRAYIRLPKRLRKYFPFRFANLRFASSPLCFRIFRQRNRTQTTSNPFLRYQRKR